MQKASEVFNFASLMLNLRKSITLMLTAAFFYSAVGHAFVLHYCNAADKACMEESCCEADEPSCHDTQLAAESCCFVSSQYLVNPFSVRQPVTYEIKKSEFISEPLIIFSLEGQVAVTHPLHAALIKDFIPPEKDLLSSYHILLI